MFLNNILGIDNNETTDVYGKLRRTYTICKSTSNIQSMVLAEIFNEYNKFLLIKNMDLHKHPRPISSDTRRILGKRIAKYCASDRFVLYLQ